MDVVSTLNRNYAQNDISRHSAYGVVYNLKKHLLNGFIPLSVTRTKQYIQIMASHACL